MNTPPTNRRDFLKRSIAGGLGLAAGLRTFSFGGTVNAANAPLTTRSQVAVTHGSDHVDNIFRAMQQFKTQIAAKIGNRPVLIKTNHVSGGTIPLADTPCECVEGILEFLKSIGKTDVTVVEGSITNPPFQAFSLMGYFSLLKKYPVRFKSLSEEGYQPMMVYNLGSLANKVRVTKILMNKNYFVISACKTKCHDRVVATLSLKNIVMGSIIVDASTFNGGGGSSDKALMHNASGTRAYGDGNTSYNNHQDLNDTICMLTNLLAPDMSVIDAYQGMQHNGPLSGTPVTPQQAAIASLDFLSADRIGTILMDVHNSVLSINTTLKGTGKTPDGDTADNSVPGGSAASVTYNWPKYPACLNYCAQNGVGQYDSNLIDLVGDVTGAASTGSISSGSLAINSGLTPLVKTYQLHDNTVSGQSLWMRPTPLSAPVGTDRRLT
jgi:uncharacterized protein (DUF362 family)